MEKIRDLINAASKEEVKENAEKTVSQEQQIEQLKKEIDNIKEVDISVLENKFKIVWGTVKKTAKINEECHINTRKMIEELRDNTVICIDVSNSRDKLSEKRLDLLTQMIFKIAEKLPEADKTEILEMFEKGMDKIQLEMLSDDNTPENIKELIRTFGVKSMFVVK